MSDWFDGAGSGKPVDVPAFFDSGVPMLVGEIVDLGAMVSVGTTSDGGALGITVTLDGRWRREYFRESEEATEWLLQARDAVRTGAAGAPGGGPQPASPGRRPRSRRQKDVRPA